MARREYGGFRLRLPFIAGRTVLRHTREPQRRTTRAISAPGLSAPFRECARSPWILIVKSGDFPVEFEEADGFAKAARDHRTGLKLTISGPFLFGHWVGVGCRMMGLGPRLGTLVGTLQPMPMCALWAHVVDNCDQ